MCYYLAAVVSLTCAESNSIEQDLRKPLLSEVPDSCTVQHFC